MLLTRSVAVRNATTSTASVIRCAGSGRLTVVEPAPESDASCWFALPHSGPDTVFLVWAQTSPSSDGRLPRAWPNMESLRCFRLGGFH